MQNHVFIFIRNVLGIKTIMRYTLSSITITKHPGTELRVIGRRGRRGQAGRTHGRRAGGRRAGCGPQGHTQRPPGGRGTLQHTRDLVLFWLFCVLNFFSFFPLLRHVRFGELGDGGREKAKAGCNEGKEGAEDRKEKGTGDPGGTQEKKPERPGDGGCMSKREQRQKERR